MCKKLLLPLFICLLPVVVFSQTEVKGAIFDNETREPLPAATILIEGTYKGTISNSDGNFSISVDELPAVLLIRYIGFQQKRIEITDRSVISVNIFMNPEITEMEEIVVTGDDPGLSIMEMVIERKKLWRHTLVTYKVDAYTRQLLRNDTSIVSINESSSVLYWDKEKGHTEVQLTRTQTSNMSEEQNFAGVRYLPNFYDNNIEIAGYNVVGITHPDALKFYNFRLLDTLQMDGKPLYKIEVIPKRSRQPLFEGVAWVLGRDYAVLEVDLKPNDVVNFPPPVQDFDLSYKQQFSNYVGEYWLPVDMRIEGLIRISMVGLRFPSIQFNQTSRLSDYEINIDIPDSVFREAGFIRADSLSNEINKKDIEPIPLSDEESIAYEKIDSTATLEEAFKPEGFLARAIERSENEDSNGRFSGLGNIIPNGFSFLGRYNRVDGLHTGLRYEKNFPDAGFGISTYGGYSFNSDFWDYGASFHKRIFKTGTGEVRMLAGYNNKTDTRYTSKLYGIGLSSMMMLFGGADYFDYYRNESVYGGFSYQNILPKTDLRITMNHEVHSSFQSTPVENYSFFGWHKDRRYNPLVDEGIFQSVKTELGFNTTPNNYGFAGRKQVKLLAEISDKTIGSDFSFTKVEVSFDWNAETFYKRRLFANTIDIHATAGTFFGNVPIQKFGSIDGTRNLFSPFGSLRTRKNLPYEGTRYWLMTAEHNFRTIPFEILGLTYLVDNGWGIIVFGGAGYSDAKNQPTDFKPMITDGVHSEIGISLNSIFGILRVDFAKRLDGSGTFIGISVPRYF